MSRKKKLRFESVKAFPRCRLCGFNYDNHIKYIPNGCNNWIPSENLEFLEWCVEKKGEDK